MTPTHSLRAIALGVLGCAVVVTAGNAFVAMRAPAARCDDDVTAWIEAGARAERPAVVVAGSSISGTPGHRHSLARSLGRALEPAGVEVWNGADRGLFLADQWALISRTLARESVVHLFEINPFFLNERHDLFGPTEPTRAARHEHNLVPLFAGGDWPVRWRAWRQAGFEPLFVAALKSLLPSYASARCLQDERRQAMRLWATGRAKRSNKLPDFEARAATTGRNFETKRYGDGLDIDLLEGFLRWSQRQSLPVVVYLPPINVSLVRESSGEPAWRRFQDWRRAFASRCQAMGVRCLDLTELLAEQPELYKDYGHYVDHRAQKTAFDAIAGAMRPHVEALLALETPID